jgi:excisionase family DNA binding protein
LPRADWPVTNVNPDQGIGGFPHCAELMKEMNEGSQLLNVGQAAAYLGVSPASLRKWSDQGLMPVYRTPGGQRRYFTSDLDEFMRSMREPPGRDRGAARRRLPREVGS